MEDLGKSIFLAADAYSRAAKYINSASKSDMRMFLPSQVIASLALELYCKSLYYIKYGKEFKIDGRHSHDFHKLFNQLPHEIQRKLESDFQNILQGRDMNDVTKLEAAINVTVPRDLKGILKEWSSVFVKVRYMYEKPKDVQVMLFFPEIEQVLRNAIFEHRPELQPK
jgi:hypothetical protein